MHKNGQRKLLISLLSVLIGLLVGAFIMWISGYHPWTGYQALIQGAVGTPFNIGQTLRAATPLICTGLAFSVAYTAGFFNIGLAGQALMGWLASVSFALAFPDLPKFILLPLSIVIGMLAGAFWAGIAGYLKAYFKTSEVIVTIMLNYIAVYVNDYLIRNILTDRADATDFISDNASLRIDWLTQVSGGSTLHGGIFLAILAVILVSILLNKTTLGFELKSVGLNPQAASYAGMDAKRNIILSMCLSGLLAGLGGVMNGLGEFRNIFLTQGVAPAIGFDGMAVALLGGLSPVGTVLSSLLLGALQTGGNLMPLAAGVPSEIVDIVTGIIIFFVGANYVITYFFDKSAHMHKVNQNQGGSQDA
ncbi:ABC transporter permease [Hutsoniella sourekii]|uniref:ABC transporter permease n=1 Tax=Hutsoniella sourekii TaxID=87650 RepID=UPI000489E4C1|nr:ABC transporter permease [Hutsoniella sourekii]